MHVTRPPGLPALAIVVPSPQLPRSSSSLSVSSPRTPRTPSSSSNTLFSSTTNRNSSDSWNSSNAADELEFEWKPEQVRLLSRTLDALPAHLVTPFHGPIPPSNLLDKIARGVAQAKGPIDWPHSLRATRVKLIELSRARAKDDHSVIKEVSSDVEMEESTYMRYPEGVGNKLGGKRPVYKQSSMDFINSADLKGTGNSLGSSNQSQRVDRPSYHPYSRRSRGQLASPQCSAKFPSLTNPSSTSSSTLNSLSSFSSANRILRRTSSNLSSTSASSILSSGGSSRIDFRKQIFRRSDSSCPPAPPPKDIRLAPSLHKENMQDSPLAGVKRAPSFGALAQESRRDRQVFGGASNTNMKDTSYPSSDEEEKVRTIGAKKMRVKDSPTTASINTGTPPVTPLSAFSGSGKKTRVKTPGTAPACLDCKSVMNTKSSGLKLKKTSKDSPTSGCAAKKLGDNTVKDKDQRKRPMNVQRNPSIIGAELPHVLTSASITESVKSRLRSPRLTSPVLEPMHAVGPRTSTPSPPDSPQKTRTLRRVQRVPLGRRISFGSLAPLGDNADIEAEGDEEAGRRHQRNRQRPREVGQLGSAIQLR